MSDLRIDESYIDVWHQNTAESDEPDATLQDSLDSVEISSRAQDVLDETSIEVFVSDEDADALRVGDQIQYTAAFSDDDGAEHQIQWMGQITPVENQRDNTDAGWLSTEATDYVGSILADRIITASYLDEDVGAIIRDIVEKQGSEVDASGVPDLGMSTDAFYNGENVWDMVVGLAARADAIIRQDGDELLVDPISALPFQFDLGPDDYVLPWTTKTSDDIKNVIRVDAGTNRKEEQAQETQTNTQRVTDSERLTHQLRARKSEVHSVDLWAEQVSDEDALVIRLQAGEDGAPVDVDDSDSDIENAEWPADDLPTDGDFVSLFFSDHTLPDRDPWMIIEADGDEGQDVGVNDDGEPTYRSYYPHPMNYEASDTDSVEEYGAREMTVNHDNLETTAAARDAVDEHLAQEAWPMKTVTFEADSPRAHMLETGDRIGVDRPQDNAEGEFIVTEVVHTVESVYLQTDITATWRKGILAE